MHEKSFHYKLGSPCTHNNYFFTEVFKKNVRSLGHVGLKITSRYTWFPCNTSCLAFLSIKVATYPKCLQLAYILSKLVQYILFYITPNILFIPSKGIPEASEKIVSPLTLKIV